MHDESTCTTHCAAVVCVWRGGGSSDRRSVLLCKWPL